MLDLDASKLLIIGVVALVVIGPKDLPRVLRQVGQMVGRLRRMAGDFQGQFMEAMREADLQDLRDEVSKLKDTTRLDVDFDPVRDVKSELGKVLEPGVGAIARPDPAASGPSAQAAEPVAWPDAPSEPAALVLDAPTAPLAPAAPIGDPHEEEQPAASPVAQMTTAEIAGGLAPLAAAPARRRRILVSKRRPPGDRRHLHPASAIFRARSGPYFSPRRDRP